MATIRIKNLVVRTTIGVSPEERISRRELVINLEIEVDSADAIATDQTDKAFDYRTVMKRVIAFVSDSKFHLLEKLTSELLKFILSDTRVVRAMVEIEQPIGVRTAESISIRMDGERKD